MSKRMMLAGAAPVALLLLLAAPGPAGAVSGYFTAQCAPCHDAAAVGSAATTCNGCHAHGTHPSSAKSSVNVAGATDATSYSPGQTVTVTITGGYRTGWIRAALFDQNGAQLALSTGPNGMGGGAGYPITLTAPAPTATGSYTWSVGWYGNQYDAAGAAFGARWAPDPNNADHGWELISTNAFTVTAPTAPAIALAPSSLNFGSATIGTPVVRTTQIQNTGTSALTVSAIALCTNPLTEPEFTWSPAPPFTVAAGAATTLTVTYVDLDVDTDTGCLTITSNAANTPSVNLAVTGSGTAPATPVANVNPLALDFGAVTTGSSATRTFTIGNAGTATLTGTVAAASGTSAEYAFTPSTFSVAAGGSTTVTVTYSPTGVGVEAGSLTVASNDPLQATIPVALTGSGVAAATPHLALQPASLDLGGVTVGASGALPVQVQNTGAAALSVTAITRCSATSAEFTWSPAAPFTVAAGGATTVTVTYAPTAAGTDGGCLAFASNDPASPTTNLTVSGTGLAPSAPRIAVAPAALDFGSVTVGLVGTRTFAVSNGGTAPLTATVARATGTSSEFAAAPASFTVAAGGSQTVTATYSPSAAGADTGAFTVTSNDTSNPSVSVTVTGTGLSAAAPSIALAPASLAFGAVADGSTATLTAQIQNTGTALLTVSAITACIGTSAEYGFSPAGPLQVASGASATLTVTYAPTDVGADAGCLAIASDDPVRPTVQLALSGSGVGQVAPAIALVPASLDFGAVADGSTASKTAQIRNTGTGPLQVSAITACAGTSAEFRFAPGGPLQVAAGGSAALTVTYAPTDVGADAGCLAIASDDPASPTVQLGLTGSGVAQGQLVGDVDIEELKVPGTVRTHSAASITPRAHLENRSRVDARAMARLQATLGGAAVYDQTIPIAIQAREDAEFAFPAYAVMAGASGTLAWTLDVTDADPDVDRAMARTRLSGSRRDEGEGSDRHAPVAVATVRAAAATDAARGVGCSSGGGLSLLGLLLAMGAGRSLLRRRR